MEADEPDKTWKDAFGASDAQGGFAVPASWVYGGALGSAGALGSTAGSVSISSQWNHHPAPYTLTDEGAAMSEVE